MNKEHELEELAREKQKPKSHFFRNLLIVAVLAIIAYFAFQYYFP